MGYSEEVMDSAQWTDHLTKCLQLTDRTRRKAYGNGQMYLQRPAIEDMMCRYDVSKIERKSTLV